MYVFDSSGFIVIGHYYPDQFPTFWKRFEREVATDGIISVREAYNELTTKASRPWLLQWVKDHRDIFAVPTDAETDFVSEIFQIPHFQMLVTGKQRLTGQPAADPSSSLRRELMARLLYRKNPRNPMQPGFQTYASTSGYLA